jgi:hypothetical protein
VATIIARPDAGPASSDTSDDTLPLQAALDAARPGDVVALLPGRYVNPVTVRFGGTSEDPLVIRGLPGAVIDGGQAPHLTRLTPPRAGGLWPPTWDDFAFFKARSLQSIIFETLTVERCWPSAIYLEDCRFVTLRASTIRGGSFGLYVRDELETGDRSHGFVIEGNSWVQEPTLWRDIDWAEAHHGTHTWLNGGLFASLDIVGNVVFSYNEVSDCYNGMRIVNSARLERDPVERGRRNRNFDVHHNRFVRVRDNPVEPESYAVNWHVHHNLLIDCHACFSLDGVGGGYWYFYCNFGRFDSAPGGKAHRRGKVFKLDSEEPFPSGPVYIFNNSWICRGAIIVGGEDDRFTTRHWTFVNNAFEYCEPWNPRFAQLDTLTCPTGMPAIGIFDWHPSNRFDYNVSNNVQYFETLRGFGQEDHGIWGASPLFDGAADADAWPLAPNCPGRRRGGPLDVAMADGARWLLPAGLDIGALDPTFPIDGPPFRLV